MVQATDKLREMPNLSIDRALQSDTEAENRGVELSSKVTKDVQKQERRAIAVSTIVSRGKVEHDDVDEKKRIRMVYKTAE